MDIVHFHNGTGGGVLSVIRNLIFYKYHPDIKNYIIYTINREEISDFSPPFLEGSTNVKVFYYSPKWNFYYTCEQLAKLLPGPNSVIVAHDWLELGMVSNLGLKNPVVQVLHGDYEYYYQLAILHQQNIDIHICVSSVIEKKLKLIFKDIDSSVKYLRFPVSSVQSSLIEKKGAHILFFVRDITEENKQLKMLPLIEKELVQLNVYANWYIAGMGMDQEQFKEFWGSAFSNRVKYLGLLNKLELDSILGKCNILVLPSLFEGFPVSVVEAMKFGLIPLTSYWDGAVSDLIMDQQNGFYFKSQNPKAYAESIAKIATNSNIMNFMSNEAKKSADILFDPTQNSINYENAFMEASLEVKSKCSFKAYGSRLDQFYLPNFLVNTLRTLNFKLF